ncbi:MAG: 16S rRNA (cytidine(1402)-2'-O)-methyltransferase [Thermomicrobiales bacterium]
MSWYDANTAGRSMGILYLVATPIGNLEDITLRALRVLREASLIAAEDTRVARKLLDHYEIDTPVRSFHEHSPETRLDEIVASLASGDVAVISDAGMPGISDPGSRLVERATSGGYGVLPIPGPSSVTAATAVSGLADEGFVFAGFLPRKDAEKRERLRALAEPGLPLVLFESPNRVRNLIELMAELFPDADIVAGREITKLHEEWLRGRPDDLLDVLTERGEYTFVIQPNLSQDPSAAVDLDALIENALAEESSLRDAVDRVIAATGVNRREVYKRALEINRADS